MSTTRRLATRSAVASVLAGAAIVLSAGPAAAVTPGDLTASAVPTGSTGAYWGAIAISVRTGNVGYAWDHTNASSASSTAVNKCNAGDCETVVQVRNGCAAVAQATNRAWGWGYATTIEGAKQQAISGAPGSGARVIGWVCTTR
ncbi:DUF4189 domain-containing protein [Pseudonocardia sp. TRM90224]|uniref:DUF4189 domain-containing protein n=1 Tax=Pseudonocardia sp. TRM90224 TaxID=2812678 RepID=UPI001E5793BC|nr:DUF4189 domain-containing protein [Pseudonocardia sp. TRM90224]